MIHAALISVLRTSSEAAKMTNNPTWATLMNEAADTIDSQQATIQHLNKTIAQLKKKEDQQ